MVNPSKNSSLAAMSAKKSKNRRQKRQGSLNSSSKYYFSRISEVTLGSFPVASNLNIPCCFAFVCMWLQSSMWPCFLIFMIISIPRMLVQFQAVWQVQRWHACLATNETRLLVRQKLVKSSLDQAFGPKSCRDTTWSSLNR